MPKKLDLTGQRFGRLVVLEEAPKKNNKIVWYCKCNCGNEKIISSNNLRSGTTKSCGCLNIEKAKERQTKHGKRNTLTYKIWDGMIQRCYNKNNTEYFRYGGRGIKVCERWWDFENFYEDMDKHWQKGLTLERIDNDDDYKPSNCKWASRQEQAYNTRAKGYSKDKKNNKWVSCITVNYKQIHLGSFDTPEEARQAYVEAKKKYHGIDLTQKEG